MEISSEVSVTLPGNGGDDMQCESKILDDTVNSVPGGEGSRSWLFTTVYESPSAAIREDLWGFLHWVAPTGDDAWLLMGDFIAIASEVEKSSGAPFNPNEASKFNEVLHRCGLLDVGSTGPSFTWRGSIYRGREMIFCHLDRAVCNAQWRVLFPDASVIVLPFSKSDHHPLFTYCQSRQSSSPHRRQFRYMAAWHTHLRQLLVKISMCFDFGGIQRALQMGPNLFLDQLEKKIRSELEEIQVQEELFWYQKSRSTWVKVGDCNTKYFHARAVIRRKRLKVEALRGEDGAWVDDDACLSEIAVKHFLALYTTVDIPDEFQTNHCFSELPNGADSLLSATPTTEEICRALFSMSPLRASGPDGFQAFFYQKNWETVHSSLFEYVKEVFEEGKFVAEMNSTLLVLIPKAGRWKPIRIGARGPPISQIMFSDDLLLFAEALVDRIKEVMCVLETFCQGSGQKTEDLGKYLGISIVHGRVQRTLFHSMLERVRNRLNGWSASSLTMAGPVTLVQSVLQSIPTYQMQNDQWVPGSGPLADYAVILLSDEEVQATVHSYVTESRRWDWERIAPRLDNSSLLRIASVMAPTSGAQGNDIPFWRLALSGNYTVASAYEHLIEGSGTDHFSKLWKNIWRWEGPQRIRFFLWCTARESLLTNEARYRRSLCDTPSCPYRESGAESALHVLRDCALAKQVWSRLVPIDAQPEFFTLDLLDWLWQNLFYPHHQHRWIRPPEDFFKFNTDGSSRGNLGAVGAGGLLRDVDGRWIVGFAQNIGIATVTMAELWGYSRGWSWLGTWDAEG
ncbi:hypothetical protein CRG98_025560 [Punica granatum]|uniref:RNase H type-1 domain-containing protein n=1 Tax=Punica granatum TaxID=22663 RepID=A0A2I0JEH1_PUNGR|nr:hypothetical protein CRG98_025560 [Punica granatum]